MGWVKSAPYFCAASETAQDVAVQYIKTRIGSLPHHKFKVWEGANVAEVNNPRLARIQRYLLEVYPQPGHKWYTWQGGSSMEDTMCSPKASTMAKTLSWKKSYARAMASLKPKDAFLASSLTETPKQFSLRKRKGRHY
jgi:hypothetical protein